MFKKNDMLLILFLILRVLDLLTTYLCISLGGLEVEGNPIAQRLIKAMGFTTYCIFNIGLSCLGYKVVTKWPRYVLIAVNVLVVASNTYAYVTSLLILRGQIN